MRIAATFAGAVLYCPVAFAKKPGMLYTTVVRLDALAAPIYAAPDVPPSSTSAEAATDEQSVGNAIGKSAVLDPDVPPFASAIHCIIRPPANLMYPFVCVPPSSIIAPVCTPPDCDTVPTTFDLSYSPAESVSVTQFVALLSGGVGLIKLFVLHR